MRANGRGAGGKYGRTTGAMVSTQISFFIFFFFLSPSVFELCLYFDSLASKLPNFAFSLSG